MFVVIWISSMNGPKYELENVIIHRGQIYLNDLADAKVVLYEQSSLSIVVLAMLVVVVGNDACGCCIGYSLSVWLMNYRMAVSHLIRYRSIIVEVVLVSITLVVGWL